MESVNCDACGSSDYEGLFSAPDFSGDASKKFDLVKCSKCALVFVNPRPGKEDLGAYYCSEYYGKKNAKFGVFFEFLIRCFRLGRVRTILRQRNAGAVLDIGCARGHMLKALKDRGWNALGTELTEESSAFAREELGLKVMMGQFEDLSFNAKSFDVVVMWHVFEHMLSPAAVIQKIRCILKEDGLLIISVPNFGSLQSMLSRDKWFHLDLPRHLYHYTPETLEFILKENGFKIIKRKYTSLEYSYFGMLQSIFNVLGVSVNYFYDLIRRKDAKLVGDEGSFSWSFLLTVLLLPFVLPLAVAVTFFVDMSPLGGNIEVHAVKSDS